MVLPPPPSMVSRNRNPWLGPAYIDCTSAVTVQVISPAVAARSTAVPLGVAWYDDHVIVSPHPIPAASPAPTRPAVAEALLTRSVAEASVHPVGAVGSGKLISVRWFALFRANTDSVPSPPWAVPGAPWLM